MDDRSQRSLFGYWEVIREWVKKRERKKKMESRMGGDISKESATGRLGWCGDCVGIGGWVVGEGERQEETNCGWVENMGWDEMGHGMGRRGNLTG